MKWTWTLWSTNKEMIILSSTLLTQLIKGPGCGTGSTKWGTTGNYKGKSCSAHLRRTSGRPEKGELTLLSQGNLKGNNHPVFTVIGPFEANFAWSRYNFKRSLATHLGSLKDLRESMGLKIGDIFLGAFPVIEAGSLFSSWDIFDFSWIFSFLHFITLLSLLSPVVKILNSDF